MMGAKARAPSLNAPPVLGLPTRPLAPEEQQQLLRRFRAPSAGVLRLLAIISGLGAVLLAVTYYLGSPYDPNSFPVVVILAGVLSIAFAAGANAIVRDPRAALTRGEVLDATAPVVLLPSSPDGGAAFQLGSIGVQVPRTLSGSLTAGQTQRIALALGLRPSQRAETGVLRYRAFLLSVNGIPLAAPGVVRYETMAAGASTFVPSTGPVAPSPPPMFLPPPPMAPSPAPVVPTPPPVAPGPAAAAPNVPPPGMQVFCDKCGFPNMPDFRFCRSCGAPRSMG